jgi:anti-sigma regulatory factor (Ser/Thr protein kinase)
MTRYTTELEIPALQSYLHAVVACVSRLCRTSVGGEDPEFQQAVLAACSNAIRRAYGGDDAAARLELRFHVGENELAVELLDYGSPIAPENPADLSVGQGHADEVRYERVGDCNLMRLLRRSPKQVAA